MTLTQRHPGLDDALFNQLMQAHETAYEHGQCINNKGHQGVNECEIDGTTYMIKCYRAKSPWSALRFLMGKSHIDTSFRYAQKLHTHGVATAKHLLAVKHLSWTNTRSYLVMEKAPGISLYEFIQPDTELVLTDTALENIAQLVTGLHQLGIAHGDLHTRNLIIADDDSVRLIDFDHARISTNGIHKDLKRFRKAISAISSFEPALTAAMKRAGHPLLQ